MSHSGRHRTSLPPERRVASSLGEDIEARLLGQRRTMCIREVSDKASVSQLSARKLWHALGLPDVGDSEAVFTEADLKALKSVAALVRGGVLDEPTALGMTMAFARSTDRLALWQTRVMGESMGAESSLDGSATARAAASRLADIADDLEPLLVYAWRRHLAAAVLRMVPEPEHESEPEPEAEPSAMTANKETWADD
ncbi:MAG: hypothetical protein ABI438_07940 [Dermatophilaceae bacterium]